jgi:5-methylthioadenosine/S-adenosylhomocysteine deaminase
MSILIKDTTILTQDANRRVLRGSILVEEEHIREVGEVKSRAERVIDGRDLVALPGLVNAHNHIAMHTMRGVADDLNLEQFLEKTFAVDARRTSADIEAGARLGALEAVKTGTTSLIDLYYDEDAVARGVTSLGLRSWLGWAVLDEKFTTQKGSPLKNAESWASRARSFKRVTPAVAPQGVYVCSEETYAGSRALAARLEVPLHTHLSETRAEVHNHKKSTGLRPVEWLAKIGFLGAGLSAAHCVWLTQAEVDLLAKSGTSAVHCPTSNMKLASGGVAPVPEMRARGVNVALGTDGVSSNNSVNMFEEMKRAGLLQKATRWDARVLAAQEVFDMATLGGARAVGASKEIGSLEAGKVADIVLVDRLKPSLAPMHRANLVSNLVYAGGTDIVSHVVIAGELVFENGRSLRVDERKVAREAGAAARDLLELKEEG